ncbi:MAG TPA: sigma-70 family RNA polymerase sigma factor [Verrucomicrobiae bacterium]|jgi:RNA polymerase sigma factor (sigma-70 family)
MMTDDMDLVREYARSGSEEAFAMLVSRHINLVNSVAVRQARDIHLAEEITQAVFVILARKAGSLSPKTILSAWLCRTAQYASADALKIQRRRQRREQETHMETNQNQNESESRCWTEIAPVLDAAMSQLREKDHSAIVLRFFEGKDFRQVGAALGVSENTAKTRVSRAMEKLRKLFMKRGITLSVAAIAGAVSANSVQAAHIGLATSVTVAAVQGTNVTTSTLTIIKTTLKIMAWTKFKTAAIGVAVALLATGAATIVIQTVVAQTTVGEAPSKSTKFAFVGYATPEAAFKSMLAEMSTGNFKRCLAACTPEQADRIKSKLKDKSDEEISRLLVEQASHMIDYELGERQEISATEVRLLLVVQPYPGHPNVGNDLQVMQKIGKEWKYAGKFGVDIKEQ